MSFLVFFEHWINLEAVSYAQQLLSNPPGSGCIYSTFFPYEIHVVSSDDFPHDLFVAGVVKRVNEIQVPLYSVTDAEYDKKLWRHGEG